MMLFAKGSQNEYYGDLSVTELSSIFVNRHLIEANQVGYASLFDKDPMEFPNRINRDVNGHSFQIATHKGTLPGKKWNAHEEKSIEQVTYYSPKSQKDPSRVISKVEFEGWRRYVEERRPTEGGRIIFHVRGLQKQSTLARIIDDKSFREIGWMEPIVATEAPILAVNFREDAIEDNPNYIDDLFSKIRQIEALPNEIMIDIKNVIALNSIDRFMQRMIECGFSEYEFEEYLKQIRPTALKDVSSPFYVAALFCRNKGKFKEARKLLKKITKKHWQYEAGRDLERSLYEQEIRENKHKYEQAIQALKAEVVHLRSRGSVADKHSVVVEATLAAVKSDETKHQLKIETEKKANNAQLAQRLAETPFGKEIIPYFVREALLERQKNVQEQQPQKPDNSPKTRARQRIPS